MNANPHVAIIGAGMPAWPARAAWPTPESASLSSTRVGPGGRTSTRRGEGWACGPRRANVSAARRHPDFIEELAAWQAAGVAARGRRASPVFDSDGRRGVARRRASSARRA